MYERRKYSHYNSFIRLIDFGFAVEKQKTNIIETVGTLDYVSPEILLKEPLTEQSDMWALGVSMFCMLVGY